MLIFLLNNLQIIMQKLDECVNSTIEDENSPNYSIEIDLAPLFDRDEQVFYFIKSKITCKLNEILNIVFQTKGGIAFFNHVVKDMIELETTTAKSLIK